MRTWFAILCALFMFPAQAETPPIACDVFDSSFCFAKSRSEVVTLRSGPDFDIYRVSTQDDHPLFSIYVGMAPSRQKGRVNLGKYRKDGVDVDIAAVKTPSGTQVVDILVGLPNGIQLHVFGAGDKEGREALADVMSNFRRCQRKGFSGIVCENGSLFKPADANLIRKIE